MAFSIKHVFLVVAVVAIGLTSLLNADLPVVAEGADLITFATLVIFGYGVWITEGEPRAFRFGFVGWGGFYFFVSKFVNRAFYLATGQLIAVLRPLLLPNRMRSLRSNDPGGLFAEAEVYWYMRCEVIGHCLFALLFGLIGGWITVYFYRKRQRMLAQRS